MTQRRDFDVALSFAGEDREYVDRVANALKDSGVSVFYDRFSQEQLWGKDLYEHLSDLYMNKAEFTVMFISKHYAAKAWTNHERRAMQARAFEESREYILPARFDDTPVPGVLPTVGYISLDSLDPVDFSSIIRRKLSRSEVTASNNGDDGPLELNPAHSGDNLPHLEMKVISGQPNDPFANGSDSSETRMRNRRSGIGLDFSVICRSLIDPSNEGSRFFSTWILLSFTVLPFPFLNFLASPARVDVGFNFETLFLTPFAIGLSLVSGLAYFIAISFVQIFVLMVRSLFRGD